ncbi:MAG: hypothetical protein A2287_03120 [Candidatus Melainabacteria bacterium RIFOXYA12_FULL_32_12]|nr:MAG: hypothetical protein A2255_05235 [Candidatus Melainabacteria bacterium RIFOXYA2_FULL_32_9]OGI24800.1 MAG: hypothetical protein A2287_03120 [Candidatus Melainabacteria bacterium RIFOXYA12_FULL_32_12]
MIKGITPAPNFTGNLVIKRDPFTVSELRADAEVKPVKSPISGRILKIYESNILKDLENYVKTELPEDDIVELSAKKQFYLLDGNSYSIHLNYKPGVESLKNGIKKKNIEKPYGRFSTTAAHFNIPFRMALSDTFKRFKWYILAQKNNLMHKNKLI